MSTNNFKRSEMPQQNRRDDLQMGHQRSEEFQLQRVQGLIDTFLNPQLTSEEQTELNENKKVDRRFERQVQSVHELNQVAFDDKSPDSVRYIAQEAMAQHQLDQYLESANLAINLSNLSGVCQGFTNNDQTQKTNLQEFQQGVFEVMQQDGRLIDICERVGEYLAEQEDCNSKKKTVSQVKLKDGTITKITPGKIEELDGLNGTVKGTLMKTSFSDDPRSLGNVAQTLKRMLVDREGLGDNQQTFKAGH